MKKENGISLIQVIVSIIIIVIISGFAIWYAENTSTEAKLTRIYTEMNAVKEAYENAIILNEIDPTEYPIYKLFTKKVTDDWLEENYTRMGFTEKPTMTGDWYYITPENASALELEKITREFVIDRENNHIYILDGFSRPDKELVYEYNDIVKLYRDTIS